ncbi:MAG: hypothetical protein EB090_06175 [Verrucomicrobia bacterium]|nr:hypothetical protein [Verrucomicrobiota bacterium]
MISLFQRKKSAADPFRYPAEKISLPQLTLLIYNPEKDPDLSARIINHVCSGIEFGDVIHLAGKKPSLPHPGRWKQVPPANVAQGQRFQALELNKYFSTPFLLHIETDGFPVNFDLWDPAFLEYDYVGAPWQKRGLETGTNRIGNGGCSLQSKKFRNFIDSHAHLYREGTLSDVFFCQELYPQAVSAGIRFAPLDLALRFSIENKIPEFPRWKPSQSFAFHGRFPCFRPYLEPFGIAANR